MNAPTCGHPTAPHETMCSTCFRAAVAPASGVRILHGDCLDVLRGIADASIDSIVTDPPAGIAFMAKSWDHDKGGRDAWIAWLTSIMAETFRVLKPGGHAVVWALPRTSHWTGMAIEDAGFEIRDSLQHLFGSGFPKALNVGKALDAAAGAERETIGDRLSPDGVPYSARHGERSGRTGGIAGEPCAVARASEMRSAPATDAAKQWEGWATALKPGHEVWWLARKPLAGTVAENVQTHGTGALNIAACRVAGADAVTNHSRGADSAKSKGIYGDSAAQAEHQTDGQQAGRWPSNVLFSHSAACVRVGERRVKGTNTPGGGTSPNNGYGGYGDVRPFAFNNPDGTETIAAFRCADDCPVRRLDEQSGDRPTGGYPAAGIQRSHGSTYGKPSVCGEPAFGASTGGASRFFNTFEWDPILDADPFLYVAKASTSERGEGNDHPTVKPIALMRHLVRLVTPPGGTVLDMFAGSGSTLVAAVYERLNAIGIEKEPSTPDAEDYVAIIRARVAAAEADVRERDAQQTLFGGVGT